MKPSLFKSKFDPCFPFHGNLIRTLVNASPLYFDGIGPSLSGKLGPNLLRICAQFLGKESINPDDILVGHKKFDHRSLQCCGGPGDFSARH
jgi:hypothetical protein